MAASDRQAYETDERVDIDPVLRHPLPAPSLPDRNHPPRVSHQSAIRIAGSDFLLALKAITPAAQVFCCLLLAHASLLPC